MKFDGKRKLLEPVENPFVGASWSIPLSSLQMHNNKQRKPARAKAGRRLGKSVTTETKQAITRLYQENHTQSQICKELGVSKGYVSKVVKQIKEQGEMRQ